MAHLEREKVDTEEELRRERASHAATARTNAVQENELGRLKTVETRIHMMIIIILKEERKKKRRKRIDGSQEIEEVNKSANRSLDELVVQLAVCVDERDRMAQECDRYSRECETVTRECERLKQKLAAAGGAMGELEGRMKGMEEDYEREHLVCDELRNLFGIQKQKTLNKENNPKTKQEDIL